MPDVYSYYYYYYYYYCYYFFFLGEMYCRSMILRMAASSSSSTDARSNYTRSTSPYEVLGVTASMSFDEIKARYHELTRYYHPDMPHGDPARFRDINAAYRVLRAAEREKKSEKIDPRVFRAERCRRNGDYQSDGRARYEDNRYGPAERPQRHGLLREILWLYECYELAIVIGAAVAVLIVAMERYLLVRRMTLEKRARIRAMDEGLPPSMPLVLEDGMLQKYNAPVPKEEIEIDKAMVKEEAYHRRATQRRFEDFREFLFVYDPDGVSSRRVTSKRFSIQYIDEALIPARCTHVWEFNSEVKNKQYDSIVNGVVEALAATSWATPDVQHIAPLVARGLATIPMNSPETAKWTFVEYKDIEKKGEPACVLALKNNRFGRLGMCQRVTVTGSNSLSPQLVIKQKADLKSGAISARSLVHGGVLPVKDLSIPLEQMKL
ncbi:hypothetical protein MOQ_004463 [Trypanosoma cruzi marinkellei]|uniref:J domain-containing protein n=1 Tax=Trypanosoma cruzi marinkellei TaxID=85056 RepID=K2NRU2_TRYCR|nr:hypothetical protein MOQ_004463 [Trypanosoma cruzi marinkellei]